MSMVIVVNLSDKFLSFCYIDRESWVFGVVVLTQPFLQYRHVPGCIALQKISTSRVSKVVIHRIGRFLLLYIAYFSITSGFWSARAIKSSQNKHGTSSLGLRGEKVRGEQLVVLPGTSEQEILKLQLRDTKNTEKTYCWVSHYIPNLDRDKVENWQSCPLNVSLLMKCWHYVIFSSQMFYIYIKKIRYLSWCM